MSKSSLAPNVKSVKPRTNFHQLKQLHKWDPVTAIKAEALIPTAPATAALMIRQAMQNLFTRFTKAPPKKIVENLSEFVILWIDSQPVIGPGQEVVVGEYIDQRKIKINRHRTNDDLRLRLGNSPNSVYVGYWGRDRERQSSAYAGKWLPASQVHQNIQRLLEKEGR